MGIGRTSVWIARLLLWGWLVAAAFPLRAFVVDGSKWPGTSGSPGSITMQLSLGSPAAPLTDGTLNGNTVAQTALNAWNSNLGSVRFVGINSSGSGRASGNAVNEVFFSSTVYGSAFGSNVLAVTLTYTLGATRVESDVLFNTASTWGSYRGNVRFAGGTRIDDFLRVALHEFGHVLGLNHPDQGGQSVAAVMNSIISNTDALTADDVAGGQFLYGGGAPVAPTIANHPSNQAVIVGGNATFSVTANGTPPLTYVWRKDGVPVAGGTGSTLSLTNVQLANAGNYAVTASNSTGNATSNPATLTVSPPPVAPQILTQPSSQTVAGGATATFTVSATGFPLPTYQWRRNNSPLPGQTLPTLTLLGVTVDQAGSYTVVVANSAATVIIAAATLTVLPGSVAPTIQAQPISRLVAVGGSAAFSVSASGNPAPTYQWHKDAVPIGGATGASYSLNAVSSSDAGTYSVVASNSAGSVTSGNAALTVNEPPAIATQPASRSTTSGTSLTLSVLATGSAPLTYQWKKAGISLPGETGAALAISVVKLTDAGSYTVTLSNNVGSITSAPAIVTVAAAPFAPIVQTQPTSQTVPSGGIFTLSVGALGDPSPTYQWRKDTQALAGATASSLTVTDVTPAHAGSFTVTVTNSLGSQTSAAALVTVTVPPAIVTQPASQSAIEGTQAAFAVAATGTGPLTYQWRKGSTLIPGATNATLLFSPLTAADAGSFTVTVTNALGSVTSLAVTLTVLPPTAPPTITVQPVSKTAISGTTVVFSVAATGLPAPTYQWRNNGVPVPGANSSALTLPNVSLSSAGNYSATATNSIGTATSDPVTLIVISAPNIVASPLAQTAVAGNPAALEVVAVGTGPLSYQWLKGGLPIASATGATLAFAVVQLTDGGSYSVVVSNAAGTVTSASALLTIAPATLPPSIALQPVSLSSPLGGSVTFAVTATGTAPLTYQWKRDGLAIAGANQAQFAIPVVSLADAGGYTVTVGNSAATATSAPATLTVVSPSRLINLSVRAQAGSGARTLIVGFVTAGSATKQLLIRGAGPSLLPFGIGDALLDPRLELFGNGAAVGENDNWSGTAVLSNAFGRLGAFAFANDSKDAAMLASLEPGAYSVHLSGPGATTGVALVELYDADRERGGTEVINASVRNFVGTGSNALIAGLVIAGDTAKTLLIRGVGPTLSLFNVPGVLADPIVSLYNGDTLVAENGDWGGGETLASAFAKAGAFGLPAASLDSALLVTLQPGAYTVRVSGAGATTGVAILEVYEIR